MLRVNGSFVHRQRPTVMRQDLRLLLGIVLVLVWMTFCWVAPLEAQDSLTGTGTPSFAMPYPAEMGTVDAASGNLHLEIPLGSFPQRGNRSLVPRLLYDSHIWTPHPFTNGLGAVWTTQGRAYGLAFDTWGFSEGGNSGLSGLAQGGPNGCNDDYMLWSESGVQHFFNVAGTLVNGNQCSGGTAYATDSSGYQLRQTVWGGGLTATVSVYAPDGTEVYGSDLYSVGIASKDSNGNYLGLTSANALAPGINNPVIDALGRKVVNPIFGTNSVTLQVMNTQGGTSNYVITTTTIPVHTGFSMPGVFECNTNCTVGVISSIGLPDGTSYSFMYDCLSGSNPVCNSPSSQGNYYGTLTAMTLPSGDIIHYSYAIFRGLSWGNNHNGAYPSYWLMSKSSNQGIWTYTPLATAGIGPSNVCQPGAQVGCLQTTVQRPDGSKEVDSFIGDPYGGSWPQTILSYDTNGTTLLSTVQNTWDFSIPCSLNICAGFGYQDVRKLSTTTTLPIPGSNVTKQSTYSYDNPQTGNVTAVKEWKYQPGTSPSFSPLADRATYITYATIGSNNDINRPLTITICNSAAADSNCGAGGTTVSSTTITYDGYGSNNSLALQSVAGVINHDDTRFGTADTARGNPTQISRWVSGTTVLTTALSYDTTGQTIRVVDPNANVTTYAHTDNFYDDSGVDPPATHTGAPTTNAYVTSVTDNIGSTAAGYYYGSGKTALSTDYDSLTTYSHYVDPFDRPTQMHYPIGWSLSQYHIPAAGLTTIDLYTPVATATASTTCTSCVHSQAILDALGRVQTENVVNNPAGQVTASNAYDGLNRVSSTTHPNFGTGDPNDVVETMQYDGLGRATVLTHPDSQTVRSAYGANISSLSPLLTQQGSPGTYGYGFPIVSVDEAGKLRQEWIDGFGHVIEVDEPAPTLNTPAITLYQYSATGDLVNVVQGSQNRTYQYDGLSRLTQEITPEAGMVTLSYVTTSGTLCSGNPSAPCSRITPAPNTQPTATSLDITNTGGTISAVDSNTVLSLPTSEVIAVGTGTVINTGNLGTLSFTTPPLSSGNFATGATFAAGGMFSISAPGYLNFSSTVDTGAQWTEVTLSDGTHNYTLSGSFPSGAGAFVCLTENIGRGTFASWAPLHSCDVHIATLAGTVTTTYTYDTANRLTQKTHSDNTGTVTYTYKTAANGIGLLAKMTDPSGSESYTYDQMKRVTAIVKKIGTTNYTTRYAYNSGGQLTKLTYPSGRAVFYNYDKVGNLCQVATATSSACNASSVYLTLPSLQYDAASRPLSATYGNGVTATVAYDPKSSSLTSLKYATGTTTLFALNYYYQKDATKCSTGTSSNNGQIQCITDAVQPGRNVSYTYDSLGRLSTAATAGSSGYPAWGLTETYDQYGNRTNQAVTAGSGYNVSLSVNPTNNQITTFTYDVAGNVIGEPSPSETFTYDAEDCDTGYAGNGSSATYTCDGNGFRVKKLSTGANAANTIYIRSSGQVIAEYDNGAAVTSPTREHLYSDHLLATVTGSTSGSGGTIIYQQRDHLSPRLYTDATGNDVGEQGTYPFGEPWYNNSANQTWVYATYERDGESGNDYALARSYANTQGRFLSPDPQQGIVGDPQSWNRYAYVENDPINLSDPSGQGFWEDLGLAIATVFVDIFFPPAIPAMTAVDEAAAGAQAADQILQGVLVAARITMIECTVVGTGEPCGGGGPGGAGSGGNGGTADTNHGGNGGSGNSNPGGGPGAGTAQDTGAAGQGPAGGGASSTASSSTPSAGGMSNPTGGSIWNECGMLCGTGGKLLWGVSNFSAGAGDALTLTLTKYARRGVSWGAGMGYGENVNYHSGAYWGGVAAGTAVGIGLSGPRGPLFGTRFGGNTPLFNSNSYLRIGWSYLRASGTYSFRIGGAAVALIKSNPHINLWPPSMWFW